MNEAVKLQSKGSLCEDNYLMFTFEFKTTHVVISRNVHSKATDKLMQEEKAFLFYKNFRDVELKHKTNDEDEKTLILTSLVFVNRPLVGMEVGSIKFCLSDHEVAEKAYFEFVSRVTKAYASIVE